MALLSSPPPLTSQTALKIGSPHHPVLSPPFASRFSHLTRRPNRRWHCYYQPRKNLDHIPKQFRQENLLDGLMDNYKNVSECLYGLSYQQMNMFTTKNNILSRQAAKVTPENITSAGFYERFTKIKSLEERGKNDKDLHNYDMHFSTNRGVDSSEEPPDLPSLLLESRIVYLGMPLYQAVTELIIAQMFYLDYEDSSKPIYLYINSTGTQDEKMEVIGCETEGSTIADIIDHCIKAEVHTLNFGVAYGQAGMILSRGDRGNRVLFPHSVTRLYLPKIFKSNGPTTDMWLKAKDLEANADIYLELLSEGVGKPKEEIAKDIRHGKSFNAKEAIEYGIADRIITSVADSMDTQKSTERKVRAAMLEAASAGSSPGAVPTSNHGLL
ncbi:ATP-dependent Clp protease proteolytic subunit [Rhynchospora pubera]|uniref:ATP-dependent Clp protease proteolytic subunit n=1 Tax=Rhynchospora pubera TaxID=906938 RepID=A0AAV8HTP0_9POAL|nr:ATP-dependent Clp protease proteolytic subunit [Rhynchospora pubera]